MPDAPEHLSLYYHIPDFCSTAFIPTFDDELRFCIKILIPECLHDGALRNSRTRFLICHQWDLETLHKNFQKRQKTALCVNRHGPSSFLYPFFLIRKLEKIFSGISRMAAVSHGSIYIPAPDESFAFSSSSRCLLISDRRRISSSP